MHEPSLHVLAAMAEALSLPLEDLTALARPDAEPARPGRDVDAVTAAIRAEPRLTPGAEGRTSRGVLQPSG
jgi:hypothetical protein